MNSTRFDQISKLFAERRMSRRKAVTSGGAGLVASALGVAGLKAAPAQEATPVDPALTEEGEKVSYLFLQSFQGGSIVPKDGAEDTYTLTLEQGLGQTIYFSDRPERTAGAAPTPQFLDGLGFPDDNPPNAALVAEITPGTIDIAVIELRNPSYDDSTHTATYDVTVLENWEEAMETGFTEAPVDLATIAPGFGPAHLFIDDCWDGYVYCQRGGGSRPLGWRGTCWSWSSFACLECWPEAYAAECNAAYPDFCQNGCTTTYVG